MKTGDIVRFRERYRPVPRSRDKIGLLVEYNSWEKMATILHEGRVLRLRGEDVEKAGKRKKMSLRLPKILFLHGLESKPGGSKVKYLQYKGYHVLNPLLPAKDFSESIKLAQEVLDTDLPDVVIGSSRGGAIALSMNIPDTIRIILIAPAWNKREQLKIPDSVEYKLNKNMTILHSRHDKVVPYEDSLALGLKLVACGLSHRMNDHSALRQLDNIIKGDFDG